ncbi:unnamed protein product [Lactuca saligna]|uniref:Uncharacterized protein n=1 Tax=Lactuca saligna TaxID=75948 RepID=A0AA35Y4W1_LACSI|nr:unnamed protein product [Lactuca saligna]
MDGEYQHQIACLAPLPNQGWIFPESLNQCINTGPEEDHESCSDFIIISLTGQCIDLRPPLLIRLQV